MSDYISRQDAIEDVKGWMPYDAHENYIFDQVLEWVKTFPSADVRENVHGEWVLEHPFKRENRIRKCSICNLTQSVNLYKGQVQYLYCPYCGAKMELGE